MTERDLAGPPWRLASLAAEIGGEVRGDGTFEVHDLRTLDAAGPRDLSFLKSAAYRDNAQRSSAGALLVPRDYTEDPRPLLVVDDPAMALSRLIEWIRPEPPGEAPGVHPTAVIGQGCEIGLDVRIGPYAVLGERCRVGAGTSIGAHAVVGQDSQLGPSCQLHPHSVLYPRTVLGARCIVHSGAVLGADGFGYTTRGGVHHKVPHAGRAVLGDDVEVGANSAVDRAVLEETQIGSGSKIDNLVQVGHNVQTGRGCILCGQAGLAGTTRLGDYVVMGGQTGAGSELGKHIEIGSQAQVAAKSAVFHTVPQGQQVAGIPAYDLREWRRSAAATKNLPEVLRRLRRLEKRLDALSIVGSGGGPEHHDDE